MSRDEASPPERTCAGHRVLAVGGTTWHVRELPPQRGPAGAGSTLVFDSEHVVRRVRRYPADWERLDDATLFALSQGT